jgi:hypothetical protein
MKKHNPVSTAETMEVSTSPLQQPCRQLQPHASFTGGLVGHLLGGFNVSQMDTFIEKPFSVVSLCACSLQKAQWKTQSGSVVNLKKG